MKFFKGTNMEAYFQEVKNEVLQKFKQINKTSELEHKKWETPVSTWDVYVVRGDVLPKATFARMIIHTKHPDTGEDVKLDTIQAKVFPASPKIPILIYNVEKMIAKETRFLGMLDVAPIVSIDDDLSLMGDGIRKVTEKHGEDYEVLRKKMENIYKIEQWEKPLNGGIGISLLLPEEKSELVLGAADQLLRDYFTVIDKRKDEPCDDEELTLRDSFWSRMVEYYLLGDKSLIFAVKMGLPLDPMTLSFLPPVARY
jgi:coproporphyrinogen III oxidase